MRLTPKCSQKDPVEIVFSCGGKKERSYTQHIPKEWLVSQTLYRQGNQVIILES